MIITLAFKHTADNNLSSKISAAIIKKWTKSPYYHVEMIVDKTWISTNSDKGAVYFNKLQPLSEKYTYIDIKVDGRKVKKMMKFAEKQIGKKYDWLGIFFSQAFKKNIEDKNKWFCSEIVAEMLKILGFELEKESNEYSPGDLYNCFSKYKYYS